MDADEGRSVAMRMRGDRVEEPPSPDGPSRPSEVSIEDVRSSTNRTAVD